MTSPLALLLAASLISAGPKSEFDFHEIGSKGLELTDNGQPVFVYHFGAVTSSVKGAVPRSCYLHPVYAPDDRDGTVITDDFNPDHPHHRGISWMWPEVSYDGRKGDMWMVKGFEDRFVRWTAKDVHWKVNETPEVTAKLGVENGWFDGDHKFLKEDVEIVVHGVVPSLGGGGDTAKHPDDVHQYLGLARRLDFTLRFEAIDKPVTIAGTSEGKKGFGGFSFRFAPRDGGAAKTIITTDKGVTTKDEVLGKHAWAEVAGTFHDKPASGRIDDLDGNPGYPHNGWLLRHGFGFLNVSYPGRKPLVLEPGKPLVLKYRVTLSGAFLR